MGGDGGSIPGRADVVRVKGYGFKRNLGSMGYDPNTLVHVSDGRLSEDERRQLGFTRCRISEEKLIPPIMVDYRGNIYNKESILRCLLDKSLPKELKYIKKSRDLKQIVPTVKPVASSFGVWDTESQKLQCPVTGLVASGKIDFFVNWTCGCLYSRKASAELRGMRCPVCDCEKLELVELVPKRHISSKKQKPNE